MSNNFKEAAAVTSGQQINALGHAPGRSDPTAVDTGQGYFYKQDFMADLSKKCANKDFELVTRLLNNFGPSDKASNLLLEKKNLETAHATEGKELRDILVRKLVD